LADVITAKRLPTLIVAVVVTALLTALALHAETIQLEQRGGVYMLPVRINDSVTVPFVLDSGAAEIAIPSDVFSVLKRTGTIGQSDYLGMGHYSIANGATVSSERYTLHKISVGNQVVTDVVANVVPSGAEPLLGQSFLQKLPAWTLDNVQHALVLHDGTEKETAAKTSPPSPATQSDTTIALICGQSVPAQPYSTVLVGEWQRPKASPLCAGIVAMASGSAAEAEYVYGKGTRLHLTGEFDEAAHAFTFHDQQGGTFTFRLDGSGFFNGGSGQLVGNFLHQAPTKVAATAPMPVPAPVPKGASLQDLFSADMLNIQIPFLESRIGVARRVSMNAGEQQRSYTIDGCQLTAYVRKNEVVAYGLILGGNQQWRSAKRNCNVKIPMMDVQTNDLTIGKFVAAEGLGIAAPANLFHSDCITMCGNVADPAVRLHWEGPHALNFLTVDLISIIAYGPSIEAASRWSNLMTAAEGQQYVMSARFNCDAKYQRLGVQLFRDDDVYQIIVGYEPKIDTGPCTH
jgi:clan AA aspartic protease (TIGR02281 family)